MSHEVRVRFAPSPTGYLHVGGLRTALYDYLYAKKVGGKFILRIEDTDRTRYVEGAVENLMKSLKQVGLEYDEGPDKDGGYGPYFQSERTEIYRKYAEELIAKDAAYYCFCSADDLEKMRNEQKEAGLAMKYDGRCRNLTPEEIQKRIDAGDPYVIRLKVPQEGEITFFDTVREKVTFQWETVDDQVLIKTDGFPTYHLANVVDDHLMKISHVIRGEEWLPSTPKHLFMYENFGWKPPKWVHLPLILNPDRSKLSKRQGDVATEDFLKKGYLPEALLNFIALLGWHASGDRELFTLEELTKAFSLKRISKAGAVFDIEKLNWMNGHYIKSLPLEDIASRAKSYFDEAGINFPNEETYIKIIEFARERVSRLNELPAWGAKFFGELQLDEEATEVVKEEDSRKLFAFWVERLQTQDNWTEDEINALIKETSQELGLKGKKLYFPIRSGLFGSCHGPDVALIISILGRDGAINRLKKLI